VGNLELLSPKGLLLLTGAAPLVLLYVLKVRRERRVVGSTWLFAAARRDLVASHPWKRLVPERSLLLELLALVLFSLALARPSYRTSGLDAESLAIVIDASASMGTTAEGPGETGGQARTRRIELAKEAATRAVKSALPGTRAFVVADVGTPRLLGGPDASAESTARDIASIEPEDVPGDLAAAMAVAASRLRGLPGKKTLLVVTDGAVAHPNLPPCPGADVRVVVVGDPKDNSAIVRLSTRSKRSARAGADTVEVFAALRHVGASAREVHVTVTLEGEASPRASRKLLLAPGKDTPVVLSFDARESDRGHVFYVHASPYDALPLDDVAYGLVPRGHAMPVTLATEKRGSWIARALEADPDVALQRLTLEELARANVDDDALVIVEGACPPALPGHDALIVGPPRGTCLGVEVGDPVERPRLTSWETADPRMRFVAMDGITVGHATPLSFVSKAPPLVRSDRGAIAVDAGEKDRSLTVLGLDVGDTDWPLRASFVLFVRNVVELARVHRESGAEGPVVTGSALRLGAPRDAKTALVKRDADPGYTRDVSVRAGLLVISPVARAGVYRITFASDPPRTRVVVANLTNADESDLTRRALVVPGGETMPADALEGHHEASETLALLGALVVLADILVVTRRPRRTRAEVTP